MTEDVTQRQRLYELLKIRLEHEHFWTEIEPQIAIALTDIPEPSSQENKLKLINGIQLVKRIILNANENEDISFLDEEILRHRHTKQISLYEEKPDVVDEETLNRFARLSYTKEGVVGVDMPFSYGQLRRITNAVYQETNNIKFFISAETTMKGSIVAEIYDFLQEIPIARLLVPRKEDIPSRIALFGDAFDKKKYEQVREITAAFHVYTFVDQALKEYFILSIDEIALGEYEVTGTLTKIGDPKKITESSRLPTKMQFLFLHHAVATVVKYKDNTEYKLAANALEISKKDLFNYPFIFEKRNNREDGEKEPAIERVVGKHPKWFKWLIWGWLCHAPQGMGEHWPLPLTIIGPPNSGKTILLERLGKIGLETQSIFKGEDSSIKGVVPSFHSTPPKRGYLCDSRRFALLDEFFRCLANIADADERKEALARLNSLLEHKKCSFSSGKGGIRVQMRAKAMFSNNPPRGVHGVEDVLEAFDKSFLTRTLIYWQKEDGDHALMIRRCPQKELKPYEGNIKEEDLIGFLDYFWTFSSRWNQELLENIYREPIPMLSEVQRNHYEARHLHHLECLMDGIVKTRALINRTANFTAEAEDYVVLHDVWTHIIQSWTDGENIRKLPIARRIHYLPEPTQWLWRKIKEENKALTREETEEIGERGMSKAEFITAYTILRSNGIVNDDDGLIRPHYLVPGYKEEEQITTLERKWSDEE